MQLWYSVAVAAAAAAAVDGCFINSRMGTRSLFGSEQQSLSRVWQGGTNFQTQFTLRTSSS